MTVTGPSAHSHDQKNGFALSGPIPFEGGWGMETPTGIGIGVNWRNHCRPPPSWSERG